MLIVATRVERGSAGEDRLVVEHAEDRTIVVVVDGAGGSGSGGLAADVVCAHVVAALRSAAGDVPDPCRASLLDVDSVLAKKGCGGEAAAVALEVFHLDGRIRGASVGDVGAWLVLRSGIVDLTEHQITKPLLGSGRARPVAFDLRGCAGRLLVATDGLFKYSSIADISARATGHDLEDAASSLIAGVRLRSGTLPDDVALVLCELTG